jgi:Phage tail assembly chaperone protein
MNFTLQEIIRNIRNKILAESDWTQFADSPLENHTKGLWMEYRQTLRDLPETQNIDQMTDFSQVVWPTKPE